MNHYELLEVSRTASQSEIKSSFRRKVKKVHPDLNAGVDDQEFLRLNEAYEVLSDPTTRGLYDLYLLGVPVKSEIEEVTPEQRYRENYKQNKARQERDRMAAQIVYKQKFYKYLRYINMACFVLSIIISYDYYKEPNKVEFIPAQVEFVGSKAIVYFEGGGRVQTNDDIYGDYTRADDKTMVLTSSKLLSTPIRIKVKETNKSYLVKGSIYVFANGIGVLLFVFSIIVVANKKYTDSRLTFGVFSVVILLWTIAMVLVYS